MSAFLDSVAAEIELHVAAAGWDQRPALFALVHAAEFASSEPDTAARIGVDATHGDALIPIEQDELPDAPLDEALARIAWPDSVAGAALAQEILILPPQAQDDVDALSTSGADAVLAAAADHADRRDARLVVAVLRDGTSAAVLRVRGIDRDDGELLAGPQLAPNLVSALLATLDD